MSGFFITGLPRSRTAWLAVAATRGEAICYHEPCGYTKSYDELRKLWNQPPFVVGVSDSALGVIAGDILNDVKPRTIIVRRPIAQVHASLLRYMSGEKVTIHPTVLMKRLEHIERQVMRHIGHPLVNVVEYEDLSSVVVVERVLNWLTPGVRLPPMLGQMLHLNIQSDFGYSMSAAASSNAWWLVE